MSEPLENAYFNWLCAKVLHLENPTPSLRYDQLLAIMHETAFVYLVSGDDNRALDGMELRSSFSLETQVRLDAHWEQFPCSVLEMLVAFTHRAELMTDISKTFWFWKFVANLGLEDYTDASRLPKGRVHEILHRFMYRDYDRRGQGGLFPLQYPEQDQRQLEIYYQFCEYLEEQQIM